jgi:uncharacterized membrane protein
MTEHEIPREDAIYQSAVQVLRGGFALSAIVLVIGILVMMLTPVLTVLVIAMNFSRLGERKFVTLSLGVLAILVTSIAISVLR